MRLFVAINLPEAVRFRLAEACEGVREADLPVRWVDAPQLHLTLKFIGEVAAERVEALSAAVAGVSAAHRPFRLSVGGFGAFPSLRSPRVLWIGVERSEALVTLYEELEEAVARLGVKREDRSFHPHVTLGRSRRRFAAEEKERLGREVESLEFAEDFPVRTVDVMRSRLGRGGARYSVVAAHPLDAP